MAAGRRLLLPSSLAVLFYANLLSAFLGERSVGYTASEGAFRHSRDIEKTIVEFDSIVPPVAAADSSKRGPLGTRYGRDDGDGAHYKSVPVTFEPSTLDFREQSIGMPRLETVKLTNPSSSRTIQLNSISGDSPVFHASFFKSKVVKPGDSTTFDVVFLARTTGVIYNTLYVHTSMGTFDYRVQGVGVANPFRLRPLLGARIPLNATYSPQITMYNPFSEPLQISEMYSSGGELHIELLTGQPQGSKSLWELRPFETKTIARANFFGRVATNHTSFIRIKTSHSSDPSIVLPVEVEVSENSRLYLSRELMDFGIVKSGETKTLPLYVLNSGVQEVHIESISVVPENPAVVVEYMATMLKPGTKYTRIATITLNADGVVEPSLSHGKIVIRVEDTVTHQLEVPYEASILHGSLSYERSQTLFRVGQPPFSPVMREIPLINQFDLPIVLYDVKLPSKAQEYFSVFSFESPFVLPPKSDWYRPFSIKFTPSSSECSFNTTLKVSTNATYFNIPLFCYDGRVQYTLEDPDEDVLDYGILSDADEAIKTFAIHNPNPVTILITSYSLSIGLPDTEVELVAIYPSDPAIETDGARKAYSKSSKAPFVMDPGYSALFRVNVSHPQGLGAFSGEIVVHTSFERVLHIPVYYRTTAGGVKLTPERIEFGTVFPYGSSEVSVNVSNYYRNVVTVTAVQAVPRDRRLYMRPAGNHKIFPRLKASETTQIGKAVFDPLLESSETVYLGLREDQPWMSVQQSRGSHQSDPAGDVKQFSSLWKTWSTRVDDGKHMVNLSLLIELDVGTEVRVPVTASLVWPSLLHTNSSSSVVEFPTTTIGNSSLQVVEVSNPSNYPVTVQPVFLHHYTRPSAIINMLSELKNRDDSIQDIDFSQSSSSFTFVDKQQKDSFSTESSVASSVLPPQSDSHHIVVAFTPKVEQTASTLLLIRNNLTVLDYVVLQGQGSLGAFTIDNIQPNSDPLMFEFSSSLLEKCHAGAQTEPIKLTKVFRMQNSGSTPLTLHMVGVGGGGCEEHGFSVTNCDREVTIKPNKTKRIEISFHPDFTLSRVSNTLRVHTSGTELLFPLVATLPQHLLPHCYVTQPRPDWEKTLAWFSVYFWTLTLVVVVGVALVRTNCGIKPKPVYDTDKNLPPVQSTGGKMFDFKDLAKSFQNTITRKLTDLKSKSMQPVETIKPTATPATPSTKQERKEREQETPPTSTITATPPPLRPSSSSTGHAQSNGRTHRQHPQAPSATVTSTASLSNVSPSPSSELTNQNLSNRYSTPPSDLKLRPPSHSTSHSPGSSHTSKVSSLRQNSSSSLGPPLSDESTKSSSVPPLSSSREKEKASSTATTSKRSSAGVVTETDKMTGTCTIVSQKPTADEQAPPTSGTDRKTEKQDKIVVKKVEPIPSASVESTALLSTPPNSRKVKPTRRSGGKVQRSPQPPEPKISTPSPAAAPPTTVNAQGQAHVVPPHKSEGFVRKESESSIKSTDSESTSSSEKLDEREDSGTHEITAEPSKPKEVPPSLAKEPNTGQTVPITPVSDSPDVKSIALDVVQKKEKDESAGGGRGKGKKRASRQVLKREEKQKKKDRERERDRERRERNVKEHVKQERLGNSEELRKEHHQQPGSGESSSSNSTEQLYEEQNDQRGDSQEADDEKSDVSSIPEKEPSHKRDTKMAERESPKPGSPLPQSGTPQKPDRLAKKSEEDNLESRSSPVVPVHAVPSTAFKTGRGKSSVIRQKSEEHSETDRRSTKKSSSSRKSSDRTSKAPHQDDKARQSHHVHPETPPTILVRPERREEEEMEEDTSRPQTLPVVEVEASEEPIPSPDLSSLETDGVQHKLGVIAKSAQAIPTSPHELAAHLLAKNSAIKRRSKQRGDKGQGAEEGHDEGDYEEDEFEEASECDTHPSGGVPGVYQQPPTAKHPRMDHSPLKSQGLPPPPFHHHHGDPPPPMAHRHMMIKPTTLSLDAEPFYPSSFQSKSSRQGRQRMVDPQAQDYPGHEGSGATMPSPHVGAPPGFSPEDAMYLQHGPFPEKHYKPEHPTRSRQPPPPPAHRKPSSPSPPYPSAVGDGPFPYEHPGVEPPEHMPGFHTPPSRPDMLYDGADEPGYPPMGGRQFPDQHRDLPVMDAHHAPKGGSRRVTPTGAGPYPEQYMASLHHHQQRQQMMGGAPPPYRSGRGERPPTGFTVTGQRSLWENPNAYRLQPLPGGEDPTLIRHQEYLRQRSILLKLYQQEQAALEAAIAREQAKRSAQTLSSLNQPYRSRSSMMGGGGKMTLPSPVSDAVWEGSAAGPGSLHDPLPPSQGFDDPSLNESIMRQRQLHQYLASHPPLRSRTYSGDSDIGGEFVSNPVQVPSSIGHPGLNRAPGPGSSEGRGQRSSLDHTSSSASSSGWPSRSGSEGSKFSKLWSPETSTTLGDLHDDHSTNSSLPFASNTYDLFENQSIWSMNNSDSSDLLSWAQYRPDSQQQDEGTPPDE